MTEYERGLLTAAIEARRRAEDYTGQANAADHNGQMRPEDGMLYRATALTAFAEWCEREANTYVGASLVLIDR